jgi:hypothetical protein
MKPTALATLGSLGLVALMGCSSSEEAPRKKPKLTKEQAKARAKQRRTAPPPPEIPEVKFTFKKAKLRKQVLPEFERQAGVRITWDGPERKVSLRLTRPVPWPEALHLVCQFTNTHLTKDYQGRYLLKDGYGGTLGSSDEALAELEGSGATASGSGRSSGRARAATYDAPSSSGGGGGYRSTTANSRSSGAPGGGVVKYNKGNTAGQILNKSTNR